MRKTIREWLEQLPEPYRSQAIWQTSEERLLKVVCAMAEAIQCMFIWMDSLQGDAQWYDVYQRAIAGEFDRPAEQPPAFPDELSVLRVNITKLVAENARLEREIERLNLRLAQEIKWGHQDCTADNCNSSGIDCPANQQGQQAGKAVSR
jgi:hypothetical protein